MTPRKRRLIAYCVEQAVLCLVGVGCFCAFLKFMAWLLTFVS